LEDVRQSFLETMSGLNIPDDVDYDSDSTSACSTDDDWDD